MTPGPIDPSVMKDLNIQSVRRELFRCEEASRAELVQVTGLSNVTVGSALETLIHRGEVAEQTASTEGAGRPSKVYRFRYEVRRVLTVFTRETEGADTLYGRVSDWKGRLVHQWNQGLPSRPEDLVQVVSQIRKDWNAIVAVGISLPGIVRGTRLELCDYPSYQGTDWTTLLAREELDHILVENDVNAAVWGYCHSEKAGPNDTVVYVYFPRKYAPGSGLYLAGRLHRGASGWGGEVAQLPFSVPWGDPDLWNHPAGLDAATTVIASLVAVVNPGLVVVHGEFLVPGVIAQMDERLNGLLPAALVPRLVSTKDFSRDLDHGLLTLTLSNLEP